MLRAMVNLWTSPRTTVWFVGLFAVWLAIGSWVSFPRDDPWRVFDVAISLRSRVDDDLTVRGTVLADSYFEFRDKAFLIGPSELEFTRRPNTERTFVLVTMTVDLPPGERLSARDAASGEELVITDTPGLFTHLGLPVTGAGGRFTLTPSDRQIAYRFPKHLGVRLMAPGEHPFRITAIPEFSLPIDVRGGKLKLGAGWDFDAGEDKLNVPDGPLRMRGQAWLELSPTAPGPCIVSIPIRKLRATDPDPVFYAAGVDIPAKITPTTAELELPIDARVALRIGRPGASHHVLEGSYEVGITGIRIGK